MLPPTRRDPRSSSYRNRLLVARRDTLVAARTLQGPAHARRTSVLSRSFGIRTRTILLLGAIAAAGLLHQRTLHAFNYVIDINGTYWGIQDDNSPRVDTG